MVALQISVAVLLFGFSAMVVIAARLSARVAALEAKVSPDASLIGSLLLSFTGHCAINDAAVHSRDLLGRNTVLVFLSSGCPDCTKKRDVLIDLLPGLSASDVAFWIIPADDVHGVTKIVAGSALESHVLRLPSDVRRQLNPRNMIPSYLFVDEKGLIVDQSHMDDDNWLAFVRDINTAG
ncbi:MAG: peroxiredoxin family protein [Brevundimonas sp.]